jgi:hypothetical protein
MIIKKIFLNKNNDSDEKNFFFVDFKDVFIYNLEKFSLLFHDVFEFFNLKNFTLGMVFFLKKNILFLANEFRFLFSVKLKKLFFGIKKTKNFRLSHYFEEENWKHINLTKEYFENLLKLLNFKRFSRINNSKKAYILKRNFITLSNKYNSILKSFLFFKNNGGDYLEFPLFFRYSKHVFTIWDITSNRIVLEFFSNNFSLSFNFFFFSKVFKNHQSTRKNFIKKKLAKFFDKWFDKAFFVYFNNTVKPELLLNFKKKFSSKIFSRKKQITNQSQANFFFCYLEALHSKIISWNRSIQENWAVFNYEFKPTNQMKIKKFSIGYFLKK